MPSHTLPPYAQYDPHPPSAASPWATQYGQNPNFANHSQTSIGATSVNSAPNRFQMQQQIYQQRTPQGVPVHLQQNARLNGYPAASLPNLHTNTGGRFQLADGTWVQRTQTPPDEPQAQHVSKKKNRFGGGGGGDKHIFCFCFS